MTVFIDTSAFYALLDADDGQHQPAKQAWATLVSEAAALVCSNYVVVETTALVQNRLGMEAVRVFQEDVLPVVRTEWVDEPTHQAGVTALLTAGRRHLSLVDCISFDLMRRFGMRRVFAFDEHFAEQGFEVIPATTQAR
jgi:predicted nucleic acid-binding protein